MDTDNKLNIAYVDDEEVVRLGIVGLLERLGGLTFGILASNGEEFIQLIRKAKQKPDVCMVDIRMRPIDGFDLVDRIKKEWPQMPIMVLTSFDEEYNIIKMIRKGVNGYMLKGSKPQIVKEALYTIHKEGHYYTDKANQNLVNRINSREVRARDFTEKDIEFLQHCCSDLSYSEIARKMDATTRSVEGLRDKIFHKYGINSRVSLVFLAMRNNFVPINIIYQN